MDQLQKGTWESQMNEYCESSCHQEGNIMEDLHKSACQPEIVAFPLETVISVGMNLGAISGRTLGKFGRTMFR